MQVVCRIEFVDGGFECAVLVVFHVDQSFCPNLRAFHKFRQFVQLFAGVVGTAWHANGAHVFGGVENGKILGLCQSRQVDESHAKADVRFVAAVIFHGVVPSHARQGGQVDALHFFEEVADHALEDVQDVFALNK